MSLDDLLRRILQANKPELRERVAVLDTASNALIDGRLCDTERAAAPRAAHQLNGSLGHSVSPAVQSWPNNSRSAST